MRNKQEVLVIGLEHVNTLGVIRSLARNGIAPIIVITGDQAESFIRYSKFAKQIYFIEETEEEILQLLNQLEFQSSGKIPVVPTSDFTALIIDKNYEQLSSKYILPSINLTGGLISKYMDKMEQVKLAKNYHLKMAKTKEINLKNPTETFDVFPCIIKPKISAYGKKTDIMICSNEQEYRTAMGLLVEKKYTSVIVQEFVKMDYEIGLIGCAHDGEVMIPGIVRKIRRYPRLNGNMSFSKIQQLDKAKFDFLGIFKLIKELHYSGMFDIEVFISGEQYFLNEINFRNSANSYFYTKDHVHIVYKWICMILGMKSKKRKEHAETEYYVENEFLEWKLYKNKEISFFTLIWSFVLSKSYVMLCFYDMKPFLMRAKKYLAKKGTGRYEEHKN